MKSRYRLFRPAEGCGPSTRNRYLEFESRSFRWCRKRSPIPARAGIGRLSRATAGTIDGSASGRGEPAALNLGAGSLRQQHERLRITRLRCLAGAGMRDLGAVVPRSASLRVEPERSRAPRELLRNPRDQLVMSVDADIAAPVRMGGLVAVVDEQDRVGVRQRMRRHDGQPGAAVLARHEIVRVAGAVERGESDRLLVEVVFEPPTTATSSRPATTVGASRAEPTITRQPALAPSPQPRPAPTGRTLIVRSAKRGGPFWMPIWGPDPTPIDTKERQPQIT